MTTTRTAEHIADKTTFDGVRLDFQIETDVLGAFGVFYGPGLRSIGMVRLPVAAAIVLSHEVCILTAAEMPGAIKRAAQAHRDGADVRAGIHAPGSPRAGLARGVGGQAERVGGRRRWLHPLRPIAAPFGPRNPGGKPT